MISQRCGGVRRRCSAGRYNHRSCIYQPFSAIALKMAAAAGDLPRNVNFAMRGEVMRAFLETHQVNFPVSRSSAKLENTDIASQGAAVTVRVRCVRKPAAPVAVTPN